MRIGRALLYILYAAAIVVLGTFITLSATNSNSPGASKVLSSSQHAGTSTDSGKAGAAIGNTGTSTGKAKAAQSSPTNSNTSKTSSADLVNTGPGNVIGLFVVASLFGSWAYRQRLLNK